MAEVAAVLTTSWKLIKAIDQVLTRLELTREHARALGFLSRKAAAFLYIVQQGLAGVDPAPYLNTILYLDE